MANDKQFKSRTKILATRGVKEYRATIPSVLRPEDSVLEVGCEWGTTTAMIAEVAPNVIGTDVSSDCIERARNMHPGIRFEVLDVFDLRSALALGQRFSKIYVDLSGFSGYRSLLDLLALVNEYGVLFQAETIIVKSGALKHLATHLEAWQSHRD